MAGDPKSVAAGADTLGSYYRGVVCKLHRGPERGRVRTASGREIPFIFAHLTMAGPLRRFTDLREGMVVGYDVGWTAKGLRISVIRIPDPTFIASQRQIRPSLEEPADLADDDSLPPTDVE